MKLKFQRMKKDYFLTERRIANKEMFSECSGKTFVKKNRSKDRGMFDSQAVLLNPFHLAITHSWLRVFWIYETSDQILRKSQIRFQNF